ncbi:MAG TPA: tetratricopeptide repeat protein, partial [Chitinophagaceae bacterium]|nr:tetratricopeptide repeat protein [Chitinophagaceae bacterium]
RQLDYIPTTDLQAYDYFQRGKLLMENRNKADIQKARENYMQAVSRDKSFAAAYAGLADTFLISSFRGYEDPVKMLYQAKKYIDTAMTLDPFSGETQASLGYWYFQSFDFHAAELTYRRSISLNPNQSNVYIWLAILLQAKGEHEEALKVYNQGTEINPFWDFLLTNKVQALMNKNETAAAEELQKKLIEKAAHDLPLQKERYGRLSKIFWAVGNKKEALAAARKSGDQALLKFYKDGDNSGLQKRAEEQYEALKQKSEYISMYWTGLEFAYAGAREKAIDCFNNAVALKEAAISLLLIPDFNFLNIKYLNMALLNRKVKQMVNF